MHFSMSFHEFSCNMVNGPGAIRNSGFGNVVVNSAGLRAHINDINLKDHSPN